MEGEKGPSDFSATRNIPYSPLVNAVNFWGIVVMFTINDN